MKRNFLPMAMMALSLLAFFGFSWADCPQAPSDLGICDTIYVEPWAHTDTCFNGDCTTPGHKINNPGSAFPCWLYISFFVTHDSNTIPSGPYQGVQDSISTFVVPLHFWHSDGGNVIFPTGRVRADINPLMKWNNTRMDRGASQNRFYYSIFRDIMDEHGNTIYNRFAQMDDDGWTDWTCNQDLDTLSGVGDSGHVFTSLVPMSASCERWWEGSRVLLVTYTYEVSDSMHVSLDSTLWSPSGHLTFVRYDAPTYVPRHNLPLTIWVGPPRVQLTSPNGGEIWLVGQTHDITWFSENFTGPNVKLEFSTDAGSSWMPIINSTPNDGVHPWHIPDTLSTQCRVRVSDADDGIPSDVSDSNFTISVPLSITVTSPNGGDSLAIGSSKNITWTSTGTIDSVMIELTRDGSTWDTLVAKAPNNGSWTWSSVTGPPSTTCKVKISNAAGGVPADTSDNNFTIYEALPPDFSINVRPDTLRVPRGYSGTYKVILTSINGFASSCTLTVGGYPDGSTATFDHPVRVPTDSSVLTLNIPADAVVDTLTLTITATEMEKGAGITHSKDVTLIVTLPTWMFKVEAFPDTQTITQGNLTTYGVTIVPNQGFSAPCSLFVQFVGGLPSGVTADFDSNPIPPNDTSILTITTSLPSTPPDTYDLAIIAVHIRQKDTTHVALIVEQGTNVDQEGDQPNIPEKFALFQNHPNPFNPETEISYCLSEGCEVRLIIYNILGRKVKTLFEGYQDAGMKTLVWDGKDDHGGQLSSGIYFYRLQAGTFSQTRKMNLIK
jgi:hypothetical protein